MDQPHVIGVDLGQARDSTAIVVTRLVEGTGGRWRHEVVSLARAPLNTDYNDVAEALAYMREQVPVLRRAPLVIDATGVGRAVYNLFTARGLTPTGVTCTGGGGTGRATMDEASGLYRVAKLDLVSHFHALLERDNLWVCMDLPLAQALLEELGSFELRATPAANLQFGASSGKHDDLAFALFLAVFFGDRTFPWNGGGEPPRRRGSGGRGWRGNSVWGPRGGRRGMW